MKNIQTRQVFRILDIENNGTSMLPQILTETVLYEREYENDDVFIQQIIDVSTGERKNNFLLILNITRDLSNLGEKVIY
ncbi:MAG TPA: hypothetical protein GX525_03365 [Bacilli bacterium]|nr:hypothetical protein [Bacilli bacterium]